MDERRSRETRARAELALVRLLHELGDEVHVDGMDPSIYGESRTGRVFSWLRKANSTNLGLPSSVMFG